MIVNVGLTACARSRPRGRRLVHRCGAQDIAPHFDPDGTGRDEDTWATLYRTESRPFPRPKSGRIAVKVINHHGDEAMKVFRVQ